MSYLELLQGLVTGVERCQQLALLHLCFFQQLLLPATSIHVVQLWPIIGDRSCNFIIVSKFMDEEVSIVQHRHVQ